MIQSPKEEKENLIKSFELTKLYFLKGMKLSLLISITTILLPIP